MSFTFVEYELLVNLSVRLVETKFVNVRSEYICTCILYKRNNWWEYSRNCAFLNTIFLTIVKTIGFFLNTTYQKVNKHVSVLREIAKNRWFVKIILGIQYQTKKLALNSNIRNSRYDNYLI